MKNLALTEEELSLIPIVVVLLVGLQAVGGTVDDNLTAQAFDRVDGMSVPQRALQVVAQAVLFRKTRQHLGLDPAKVAHHVRRAHV